MSKALPQESEPLFLAYGHAVFAAQLLEHGMQLLMLIINHERSKSGLSEVKVELDDPKAYKTLGILFKDVLQVEFITDADDVSH